MTPSDRLVPLFVKLNDGWNAEPNVPVPKVTAVDTTVDLRFYLNPFQFKDFPEGSIGRLTFTECSRWRLGRTNDEGWYLGQCRYSKIAPEWGEFYDLVGPDEQRDLPTDWHVIGDEAPGQRHFLFYLRDDTFECIASAWIFNWSRPNR